MIQKVNIVKSSKRREVVESHTRSCREGTWYRKEKIYSIFIYFEKIHPTIILRDTLKEWPSFYLYFPYRVSISIYLRYILKKWFFKMVLVHSSFTEMKMHGCQQNNQPDMQIIN